MGRQYFPRQEFQRLGFSEVAIRILEQLAELANTIERVGTTEEGLVDVNEGLEDAQLSLDSLDARLDVVESGLTAANAAISSLDGRLDTAEADITALESAMNAPIDVKDEGGSSTAVKTIDFVGAGVTVTFGGTTATVTIP